MRAGVEGWEHQIIMNYDIDILPTPSPKRGPLPPQMRAGVEDWEHQITVNCDLDISPTPSLKRGPLPPQVTPPSDLRGNGKNHRRLPKMYLTSPMSSCRQKGEDNVGEGWMVLHSLSCLHL